jgi:hypothetical protein
MAYITKKSDLGGSKAKEKYIAESNIYKKPSYITKKSKSSYITKKQKEDIIDTAKEATEWIKKKPTEWIKKKEFAGGGKATHGYGKAFIKGGKVK